MTKIPGKFDFPDYYDRIAEEVPDDAQLVEVGVWRGASAAYLAAALLKREKKFRLWLVDRYRGGKRRSWIHETAANLCRVRVLDHVSLIQCESTIAARIFDPESLDFVFLDGDHSYAGVCDDIDAWCPKIKPGGLIGGHDLVHRKFQVKKAVSERLPGFENLAPCWHYEIPFGQSPRVARCPAGTQNSKAVIRDTASRSSQP